MRRHYTIGAILLLMGTPLPGKADTVFSDYGPSHNYSPVFNGYEVGNGYALAAAFSSPANYTLTQIDLSIEPLFGNPTVIVDLLNDSSGMPGALIESWNLTLPTPASPVGILETVTPVGAVPLLAGTQYWLQVAGGSGSGGNWFFACCGPDFGPVVDSLNGSVFSNRPALRPAFDVLGSPVPEPRFLSSLVIGIVALAWIKRYRLTLRQ